LKYRLPSARKTRLTGGAEGGPAGLPVRAGPAAVVAMS
jgi:hypothetical protein